MDTTKLGITQAPGSLPNQSLPGGLSSADQQANGIAHQHLAGLGYPAPAPQARCEAQPLAALQAAFSNAPRRLDNG